MTDFGIAKEGLIASNDRTATFCGTPEYLAPEILKGEPYGKPIDWWSLGTLIFEMFTGSPPFYSTSVQTMCVKRGSLPPGFLRHSLLFPHRYKYILERDPPYPPDLSPEALSVMQAFLQRDPTKRLVEPKHIKEHKFFRGIDWDKLFAKEVTPPYVPPVKSKDDVSMISREFLDLKVELDSDSGAGNRYSENFQRAFNDF
jgi:serine/threonine protein kinase